MSDANVVKLVQPGSFADPLTEVLRNGARAKQCALLARANVKGTRLFFNVEGARSHGRAASIELQASILDKPH